MRGRAAVVLLLAACGGTGAPWAEAPAGALDLEIAVSATKVRLLEPVTVHLDLWRRDEVEVEWAPEVAAADFLVEKLVLPAAPFGGGWWQRTTLVLRPVRGPGDLVLPPFVAKAKGSGDAASTPETTITVESALAGEGPAIEPPGEPFPEPPRLLAWGAVAAAAALLLAVLFFGSRRLRRRAEHREQVALPPHVKAQRALVRLRTAPRTTRAQVEAFYVEVSGVLRCYLEERFGLRAPERTTEEFLRDLEAGDVLAREHRGDLARFLSQCDLVKFAAAEPGEPEHLATWQLADGFVEATRGDRAAEVPA
jgi:hypothetical protein